MADKNNIYIPNLSEDDLRRMAKRLRRFNLGVLPWPRGKPSTSTCEVNHGTPDMSPKGWCERYDFFDNSIPYDDEKEACEFFVACVYFFSGTPVPRPEDVERVIPCPVCGSGTHARDPSIEVVRPGVLRIDGEKQFCSECGGFGVIRPEFAPGYEGPPGDRPMNDKDNAMRTYTFSDGHRVTWPKDREGLALFRRVLESDLNEEDKTTLWAFPFPVKHLLAVASDVIHSDEWWIPFDKEWPPEQEEVLIWTQEGNRFLASLFPGGDFMVVDGVLREKCQDLLYWRRINRPQQLDALEQEGISG